MPDFFARKARLAIELAWAEGPRGRILPEPGELRYPIGYTLAGPETRSGFAVHYSAPFASDTVLVTFCVMMGTNRSVANVMTTG